MITVDANGNPRTGNAFLAGCTLACAPRAATVGEFAQPAELVCTAMHCGTPAPSVPPPGASALCPVPVPGPVILTGPVWGEYQVHFYVPFPSWAFAAAHASLETGKLGSLGLRESPSLYFATALKESYMGCSDKLPAVDPYKLGFLYARPIAYATGCLQIDQGSAWVEMCRMYPETIDCNTVAYDDVIPSTNQDQIGRDNFVSSSFVKEYYDVVAYAMLTTHGMPSPNSWFAGASDPQAMVKVMALLYNEGDWTGDATAVALRCQHDLIENCLGNKDYVVAVSSYARELEAAVAAGNCYNETISVSDVDDYVAQIVPLFVREDATALRTAGRDAFLGASGGAPTAVFQKVGGAVLQAIEGAMQAKAHCPGATLAQWYMHQCPN